MGPHLDAGRVGGRGGPIRPSKSIYTRAPSRYDGPIGLFPQLEYLARYLKSEMLRLAHRS